MASKFEDPKPLELYRICELSSDPFDVTEREIKAVETQLLRRLDWRLVRTTHFQLLSYISQHSDQPTLQLARFLIELAIIKDLSRKHLKSSLVVASLGLAESILRSKASKNRLRVKWEEDLNWVRCYEKLSKAYLQQNNGHGYLHQKYGG